MLDVGRWTLDVGRWTLDVGRWTLDVGRWTLDVGRWTLDVGRWDTDVERGVMNCARGRQSDPIWKTKRMTEGSVPITTPPSGKRELACTENVGCRTGTWLPLSSEVAHRLAHFDSSTSPQSLTLPLSPPSSAPPPPPQPPRTSPPPTLHPHPPLPLRPTHLTDLHPGRTRPRTWDQLVPRDPRSGGRAPRRVGEDEGWGLCKRFEGV
jgi:hypothetical protein